MNAGGDDVSNNLREVVSAANTVSNNVTPTVSTVVNASAVNSQVEQPDIENANNSFIMNSSCNAVNAAVSTANNMQSAQLEFGNVKFSTVVATGAKLHTTEPANVNVNNSDVNRSASGSIKHNGADRTAVVTRGANKLANNVIGGNAMVQLDTVPNYKWVHLSSFKPEVNADEIIQYAVKFANVKADAMKCFKLVRKDCDLSKLHKVSFKLGVLARFYDRIMNASVWPPNVDVRPFRFFQRDQQSSQGA